MEKPGWPLDASGGVRPGMSQELLDLVDADNKVIGTVPRSQAHGNPTLQHRAVHVIVFDRHGSMLLQKRSTIKDIQPGKWDTSVGGHLSSGENYTAAAIRETQEELGLSIGAEDLERIHTYRWTTGIETEHVETFKLRSDGPFTAHPEEIENLRFWTIEELETTLGSGEFTSMLEHELELFQITHPDSKNILRSQPVYLDPDAGQKMPAEPPSRNALGLATRDLHDAIDANIRRNHLPYLHPDGESLQLDLFGSEPMIRWQERKAAAAFLSEESWSVLPQIYGRYGTENGRLLISAVCKMENAASALITDGGMQACSLVFDVLFTPGSHAVITRSVYNKTKAYLHRLAERQNSDITFVDDADISSLESAIQANTSLLFTETYTNPLMRALNPDELRSLIAHARSAGAVNLRVVVDNTVATPWGLQSALLTTGGVDVVVASGTKAMAGQDRDMWGYLASNDLSFINEAMDLQAMRGGILDWRRADAILTGLDTAKTNYEHRCKTASIVSCFLANHQQVAEVFHPSLPDHPDSETISTHYRLPGSMISFRLHDADENETRHFCDVLSMTRVPRYALSFDGLATKINHHRSVSEHFTSEAEVLRIGVGRLIRLGIGIEDAESLIACLNWALWRAQEISPKTVVAWQRERRQELLLAPEPK